MLRFSVQTICCASLMWVTGIVALAPADAAAQQVYQWKDAQGRTHYTGAPPRSGRYTVRGVSAQPAPPEGNPAQATTESAQCKQARANLGVLRAGGPVQMNDGDGTPRLLTDEQRAAQIRLAETVIETNCTAKE